MAPCPSTSKPALHPYSGFSNSLKRLLTLTRPGRMFRDANGFPATPEAYQAAVNDTIVATPDEIDYRGL